MRHGARLRAEQRWIAATTRLDLSYEGPDIIPYCFEHRTNFRAPQLLGFHSGRRPSLMDRLFAIPDEASP